MKVSLVTCLSADWQQGRTPDPYVPMGLLCLAAVLEENDVEVEIIDQTLAMSEGRFTDPHIFYGRAAQLIAESNADIVGFTTMCNSYPQTVELARRFNEIEPDTPIIFGGPQATAVDVDTINSFPWVEFVVRGEADETFPALITALRDGREWRTIPGLTWREHDAVQRTLDAPLVNLNNLPIPAYHLYPLEQYLPSLRMIPIDAGRGCPFECTFCSTNLFFKRRYRMKSPERLVHEITYLREMYDHSVFDFVHDMFTVNKKLVTAICDAFLELDEPILWGCSARADCVTPELLTKMSEAGCRGLFFGLESGSGQMQRKMRKKLNPERVRPIIQTAVDLGYEVTTSFICGFPEETDEDLFESLNMIVDFAEMNVANIQLHMLAPLVGSPLYYQYKDDLRYDGHCSDISTYLLIEEEVGLVENYPQIFSSFYHPPTHYLDREKAKAVSASTYGFPTLLILLRQLNPDLSGLYDRWLAWKARHVNSDRQDYYNNIFGLDFCLFLCEEVEAGLWGDHYYLRDYANYIAIDYGMVRESITTKSVTHQFNYDVRAIHEQLSEQGRLTEHPQHDPRTLMFTNNNKSIEVVRISEIWQQLLASAASEERRRLPDAVTQMLSSTHLPDEMVMVTQ